jgi:hypothetical protein
LYLELVLDDQLVVRGITQVDVLLPSRFEPRTDPDAARRLDLVSRQHPHLNAGLFEGVYSDGDTFLKSV